MQVLTTTGLLRSLCTFSPKTCGQNSRSRNSALQAFHILTSLVRSLGLHRLSKQKSSRSCASPEVATLCPALWMPGYKKATSVPRCL
jgi:hypothetical protein